MPRQRPPEPTVDGLNPHDPGVALLARAVADAPAREILLVCCGDVPGVGREATRLVLDVREIEDPRATVRPFTAEPPQADEPGFGHAIVWPRPHLGKDFTFACLARGALALRPGGHLWCAIRKAKGADSIADEIVRLMGEVDVVDRDRGYRLLRARKHEGFDPAHARAVLGVRYVIEDPDLPGLSLHSAPGVFSRRELDAGTRELLRHASGFAAAYEGSPAAVLDLGCGIGPLALWAATRWPAAQVVAVDSSMLAVSLARANAERHGLSSRVHVLAHDGLPADPPPEVAALRGSIELALVNPPTHADPSTLRRFADELSRWLAPGTPAMLVVSRAGRMHEQLAASGARVRQVAADRYTILEARWDPA